MDYQNFSMEWDRMYREHTHLSVWPWSDLVSYVMRYARPTGPAFRVLELGCGAGANIPLFVHLGCDYCAIEGSETMVGALRERFPQLAGKIVAGDFTCRLGFDGPFDLILDRASLTHNTTAAIRNSLKLIRENLKPGGKFIGIDWFSTEHGDFRRGLEAEDPFTRRDIPAGTFAGVGRVHFSDQGHLEDLFAGFTIDILEHKTVTRQLPGDGYQCATWNLVATRTEGAGGVGNV